MEKPFQCRRRKIGATRFDVNVDVQLSGLKSGAVLEAIGVIRNLSMRGALIETHAVLTTGDQLTLQVTLPNRTDLLEIPAVTVRWARGNQLGVEFLKLTPQASRELRNYLSSIHNAARQANLRPVSGSNESTDFPCT
jgi:PilZ domain-containing protein